MYRDVPLPPDITVWVRTELEPEEWFNPIPDLGVIVAVDKRAPWKYTLSRVARGRG